MENSIKKLREDKKILEESIADMIGIFAETHGLDPKGLMLDMDKNIFADGMGQVKGINLKVNLRIVI